MENPPFQLSTKILNLVAKIQEASGELKTGSISKPSVKLRKENKIRTVHSSLSIEGNSLSEEQMTAILEKKRVLGPKNQILEVQNALKVYESISNYNPLKERDLLQAHKDLMKDLVKRSGKYRVTQVGIFKATKVSHMAPPAQQVPKLMTDLFRFIVKNPDIPWLIKACVFHYELEFIHPFEDGNGRMGRLWQQLLLMKQSPIFEYISAETLIYKRQNEYYRVLEKCDKAGDSTLFIEFCLENILEALQNFQDIFYPQKVSNTDRIVFAVEYFGKRSFSRKDYMKLHKGISSATASRDLTRAVQEGLLRKKGDKSQAIYSK